VLLVYVNTPTPPNPRGQHRTIGCRCAVDLRKKGAALNADDAVNAHRRCSPLDRLL
jgi:hypothetical protein